MDNGCAEVVVSSWMELILDFVSSAETVGGTNTNLRASAA